ncbi:MAG TPA: GTPase [Firmicutes bacterium]|nr:GTPase [Bacillota bacterium]
MGLRAGDDGNGRRNGGPIRVLIMGAAGRDFHNFNVVFRDNPAYRVVAFTATQIPDIAGRRYPPSLCGPGYPDGIPIYPEEELPQLVKLHRVDRVVFAYSDVPHEVVMHRASEAMALGADFWLLGPDSTMLVSERPVVSICAVRTGAGKSQTARRVADILRGMGKRVAVVRHPMPYGELDKQVVQRFATRDDLDRHRCTVEEREEYEPHLERGNVVFAGVDYEAILEQAEREGDVVFWEGGNNDLPFFRPDLHIVVADPHRPGHELTYHPGEANVRLADVVVINKVDTAPPDAVEKVRHNVQLLNPLATIVEAASPISVADGARLRGRKVVVVEDGPTLTHGGMTYGAGVVAARRWGAELVDPRPHARGSIAETFRRYQHLGPLLPAMGYGSEQLEELRHTLDDVPAELVLVATPIDLARLIPLNKPAVRVTYELQEIGRPNLEDVMRDFFEHRLGRREVIKRTLEPRRLTLRRHVR